MLAEMIDTIHPGEILREDFLVPANIDTGTLADLIGLPSHNLEKIIDERAPITRDTAERLAAYFGTSVELWLNLQRLYDLSHLELDAA